MTGRRRRGSTSSTDTTTSRSVHWCQESSVLRALPSGTPDDDLPIFELADATVLNKDGLVENALDILLKGPFIVRGNMVVDDAEQRRHLIRRVKSSVPIELSACTRYSIGESEDADGRRHPVLWLAGRSAWFEINPCAAYLPTYRNVYEAIRLYYFVFDYYTTGPGAKSSKAKSRTSKTTATPIEKLSPVFLEYAIQAGDGSTLDEVSQRCQDLAPFFFAQFVGKQEEHKIWQKTPFYKWLTEEQADLFERTLDAARNPRKATLPTKQELPSRTRRGTSGHMNEITTVTEPNESLARQPYTRSGSAGPRSQALSAAKERRSKGSPLQDEGQSESLHPSAAAPSSAQNGAPPTPSNEESAFETVLSALNWAYDQLHGKKGFSKTGFLNKIYFSYRFPTFKNGQSGCHRIPVEEVFHYNAEALINTLDPSKWENCEFYAFLQDLAKAEFKPVALKPSDLPFRILPRGSKPFMPRNPNGPSAQPSGVVMGGPSVDDAGSPDQVVTPRRGKGIKTPGRLGKSSLRPAASSKKRPHSDVDSDSESESPDVKKSHYFSDAEDAMEGADTSAINGSDGDEEQVKIVIRADKIPSSVPHGPHGTWTCDQEDCDYIVRGGDAQECQERIQKHFEEHEQQMEKVQLAMSESTRGHLPINHLLDKIKKLGDRSQQEDQLAVDGVPLPRPIQRKLIV